MKKPSPKLARIVILVSDAETTHEVLCMITYAFPLLSQLQRHFKLRCTVTMWARRRSRAYVRSRRIFINPDSPLGEAVVLHEFAHLLAERRVPGQGHWHKVAFREALCDVNQAADCNLPDYPWHREYLSLYRWAVKHGYTTHSATRSSS
jgi:hypothetical protein